MALRPLLDKIVVMPSKLEEKTAGGIILTNTKDDDRVIKGTVVAVGPGIRKDDGTFIPLTVSTGDTVLFDQYVGNQVKVEGTDYLVLTENSILGVLA